MAGGGGVASWHLMWQGDAIRLYEFASGKLVALLKGHKSVVYGPRLLARWQQADFGQRLTRTAIIWDIPATPRELVPKLLYWLEGHKDYHLRRWLQPRWQPRGDGLLRP